MGGTVNIKNVNLSDIQLSFYSNSISIEGYPGIIIDNFYFQDAIARGIDGLGLRLLLPNAPTDTIVEDGNKFDLQNYTAFLKPLD